MAIERISNFKFQISNSKSRRGFTLVEVLMVVFIMGIIIIIGGNLFFAVLKGASKAELTKEVKQNGDYSMAIMERMIRNAQAIVINTDDQTCSLGMNKLKIQNPDGGYTEFACYSDTTNLVAKVTSDSGGYNYMTNNKVSLTSGGYACPGTLSFGCSQTVGAPPTVTVSFTLYQKGTSSRPEELASVLFEETISLRKY